MTITTRIAQMLALPLILLGGAANGQSAFVPPPDTAPLADNGPTIAAPPHAATMDPASAQAQPGDRFGFQDVTNVGVFEQALAPHGRWVSSRWGNAFLPDAPEGWRPYQNGQWGPDRFWRSEDPWGWATDHYGRWGFDDAVGWVWVPGTQWAPSWAAWREDDEVVGWAPIPPQVSYRWDAGFGDDWRWNDWNSWYAPSWVWVPRAQIFAGGYRGRALPWNNGARYWRGSRWNWGLGFTWNDWNRRGVTSIAIGFGNGWNNWGWNNWGWNNWGWNNWGWNRPWNWNGGWGWSQPFGWNNWGWNNRGWNRPGWGWNGRSGNWGRRDWDRRDWDRGDRGRGDWNRGDRDWRGNDPRRGAPGSVGDYIGRGLNGMPRPDRRSDGGLGRRGGGDGNMIGRGGMGGDNFARGARGAGGPPPDRPSPRERGGFQDGVGASIGRAMAAPAVTSPAVPMRDTGAEANAHPH